MSQDLGKLATALAQQVLEAPALSVRAMDDLEDELVAADRAGDAATPRRCRVA